MSALLPGGKYDESQPVTPVRIAVLTISDTRDEESDTSGHLLAERAGMKPVFETARMYTQQPPAMPLDKLFGVTSFELG